MATTTTATITTAGSTSNSVPTATVTVSKSNAVPPPLTTATLVNRNVPTPLGTNPDAIQQQQLSSQVSDVNGHAQNGETLSKKKRKRSESDQKGSRSKKQKVQQEEEEEEEEAKKKDKKKKKKRQEESVEDDDGDDDQEEARTMSREEFEQFVESIMEITKSNDPKAALLLLEHKLSIIDDLKLWFGLELHDDDGKVLALLKDTQLSGIYKGMVMGKLVLPMDDFQKDGAIGFINHLLESEAQGKHLLPYAFCCWDAEREVSGGSLDNDVRAAALNPTSKNFWRLNNKDEMKKALRRTKFWYCFAQEMDKAIRSGQVNEETLTWEDLKAYCEAFWYENPEAKKFRKFYVSVHSKGNPPGFQSFPAWPVPKGAYKDEKDFLLGVWPFVQVYFMSPKEGPVVLLGDKKTGNKTKEGEEKNSFDFKAALEKRQAKTGQRVQHDNVMVIDDEDEDEQSQEAKKKHKHKKNKSKGRLTKFTDSQAEEDSDEDE